MKLDRLFSGNFGEFGKVTGYCHVAGLHATWDWPPLTTVYKWSPRRNRSFESRSEPRHNVKFCQVVNNHSLRSEEDLLIRQVEQRWTWKKLNIYYKSLSSEFQKIEMIMMQILIPVTWNLPCESTNQLHILSDGLINVQNIRWFLFDFE